MTGAIPRDLDIVIAGAGIGGLATALTLHAQGFGRVRLLEAAASIAPLGVGLNVLPNATRTLDRLGVLGELAAGAIATSELVFFHRHGGRIWTEPRGLAAGYRWPQLSIQRSHLQGVLLAAVRDRLGPESLIAGARVSGVSSLPDGRVEITGACGRRWGADLLIGADGVHSGVRAALYPDEGPAPSNGMVMWRGTTWSRRFLSGTSMAVTGDDVQRMVFYPIAADPHDPDRVLINWVAARPAATVDAEVEAGSDWDRLVPLERVRRLFGSWQVEWLDIPPLLEHAEKVYEYRMIDRDPVPSWHRGNVVLLGDAAHAMYPMGSNGATQSIIDADVLARFLADAADVAEALVGYDAARRPAMTALQASNRQQGPEAVISLAYSRAPGGFTSIEEVMSAEELAEHSARYARTAGFDIAAVNGPDTPPDGLTATA